MMDKILYEVDGVICLHNYCSQFYDPLVTY